MSDLFYRRLREWEPTKPVDGVYYCKWCRAALTGCGKRYCSQGCQLEYEVRRNWNLAKWEVEKRDRGVCSACGVDTYAVHAPLLRLCATRYHNIPNALKNEAMRLYEEEAAPLRQQGWNVPTIWHIGAHNTFFDVDHILPVVEGGGGCGLDNLRTLCHPCHKRMTAELAARRKVAR